MNKKLNVRFKQTKKQKSNLNCIVFYLRYKNQEKNNCKNFNNYSLTLTYISKIDNIITKF